MTTPESDQKPDPVASEPDAVPGEAAEKAEAIGADTIEIEVDGHTWEVPASYGHVSAVAFRAIRDVSSYADMDDLDVEDIALYVDLVEELLGRRQFRRWSRQTPRPGIPEAAKLVTEVVKGWGTSMGE